MQTGLPKPSLPPALEFEDDAPALFKPLRTSPRAIIPWGGFTSLQVNINAQGQNILRDAANEPSLCVDPNNPSRIAVGWRQFDSVASNFRQAGYGLSADGGLTWAFPGRIDPGVFHSDPVLGARYDSTFYYLTLLNYPYPTQLWSSINGGASWTQVGPSEGGDKQWFTIDNTASPGRGNIYQLWDTATAYTGLQFTRTVNGGASWMSPIAIPGQPLYGVLDVDNNGTVYLCGSKNGVAGVEAVRSSNAKFAGQTPAFDLTTTVNMGGDLGFGLAINPGGLSGQMWLAVDRSSSASPQPVYVLASIAGSGTNPCDVMFARSLNGNVSWSNPIRVNDDPLGTSHYHWFGSLAVSPTGRLDAVWNDTRDDATHATSSLYYAFSLDGGQHFSANIRVSPSFNQSLGYPNQNKMGDYIGVVSNSVGANIAYTATFNNEEDIYFMNIPPPAVVAPTSFQMVKGASSGGIGALASLDGIRMNLSAYTPRQPQPMIDMKVQAHSPSFSPKALLFNLVSNDNYSDAVTVSFFNWTTGAYESVKTTQSTTADSTVSVLASGDLTRFVNQSTGEVRAELRWAPGYPVWRTNWVVSIDQAAWNVIP